jgi:replicative DNA helicase
MRNLPLWIDDDPANTIDKIRRRVLALKADGRIGLVVIDYAQLAAQEQRGSSREQDVAAVALGIRLLARESMLPVVVLSQLNDDGKIRESRKLTHEAVTVLKLERENNDLTSRFATLFVAKGRKIPASPIALEFDAAFCRISERSGIDDSDVPKNNKRPYKE